MLLGDGLWELVEPHLVLHHGLGVTWTSVHVVLRKPAGAGVQATS